MKVCVINGSPKGKYSVTVQTSLYLEKIFSKHQFTYLSVGQKIRAYEKDMSEAIAAIKEADLLLFSYPVYTFLAPSQLHHFITLLKEANIDLSKKFATQISTSKHFYDVTAHHYIEDNCHDMGLKVIHGLSADMEDLTTEKGQKEAIEFFRYVSFCVEHDVHEPKPITKEEVLNTYTSSLTAIQHKDTYETVIVADLSQNDTSLKAMIDDFCADYPYKTRIVNIAEYPFSGGCLGCFHCAGDGICIHKDKFDSFLRDNIQKADSIVYAFTIKDHSMGPHFKMYDDRQFCNGHRTVTEGMPFGYIVNGNYQIEANLQMVVDARCEVGHNFLAGVGTNSESIHATAQRMAYALENQYIQPRNFYGVGGMKIFRDLIWMMRGLMKADHQFYKKHGVYDFPQKHRAKMIKMCFLGALVRNPKVKAKMGNKMNEGMIAPYKKIIENAKSMN